MKKHGFILFLLYFISPPLMADYFGYEIEGNRQKISFAFELVNNLIIVPVVINDSFSMKFILDTGVRTSMISAEYAANAGIMNMREIMVTGLGKSGKINAYAASNIRLSVNKISGKNQTLIVINPENLNLDAHLGMKVHGILGSDFLSQFMVKINYTRKRITFYKHGIYHPGKAFVVCPLYLENGRLYVDVELGQNTSNIKAKLLIDTGASHSLLLELAEDSVIKQPNKTIQTIIGWGLGGEIQGKIGRLNSFSVGNFQLRNLLSSYISPLQRDFHIENERRFGSVGGEILSRFTLILDYSNQKLYLKKNHQFRREFEYNLSGMEVVAEGKEFKTFSILSIMEDSPATLSGLQAGDIILSMNGKSASSLSLEEIHGNLRSRRGTLIELIVLRNGVLKEFQFKLKRLI